MYELDEASTPAVRKEGVIREGAIDLCPRGETRTTHSNFDADRMACVDPDGCPECSGDLEVCLVENEKAPFIPTLCRFWLCWPDGDRNERLLVTDRYGKMPHARRGRTRGPRSPLSNSHRFPHRGGNPSASLHRTRHSFHSFRKQSDFLD